MQNVKRLRHNFPAFAVKPDWVYLDTGATSQMPQSVIDAIAEYQCAYRVSVHRGLYKEAVRATENYEEARAKIARFIGAADSNEVIFTTGATMASNMLTYALERSCKWGSRGEIVTTVMEHHASLIPLQELAKRKNLTLKHIPLKGMMLDYKAAESLITKRTKVVSVTLASNVLGTINDVTRIARMAHAKGAIVIADAAAAAGHIPFSVRKLGVDFLYFSGHKMCGPTGIGVLYGTKEKLEWLEPSIYGGGMIERATLTDAQWTTVPRRFEPGTPNVAGAIGLGAAVEYLTDHNLDKIRRYVEALVTLSHDALRSLSGVRVLSARPNRNVGMVSFVVDGVHAHDVAEIAARKNIAVRAGHHCAMPLHNELGVPASVRASMYLYNTKRDIDSLVSAVKEAQRLLSE